MSDIQKKREKEKELEKCLDKHRTKPSIIYLVLFIEFPVYVCVYARFVLMTCLLYYPRRIKNHIKTFTNK